MRSETREIIELTSHRLEIKEQVYVREFQVNHDTCSIYYRTKHYLRKGTSHVQEKKYHARRAAGQTDRAVEPPLSRRHRSAVAKQAGILERQRAQFHIPARAVRQGHQGSGGIYEPDCRAHCTAWRHS